MKEQKVIRTYPVGYGETTELQEALNNGFEVVMCNSTYYTTGVTGLEYIVEREIKKDEDNRS